MLSLAAHAQSLESAVMPGPVIRGHADLEAVCDKCHVRFDRAAQARLCLACHKPVAADVAARRGYHGRLQERDCRTCHTEHKGRDARVVKLDEAKFDHGQTDFVLRGKHRGRACASCHRAKAKYREAPTDCAGCHRKDDKHKGNLGNQCENCHGEETWKDARFDHGKTKFPLRLGHADVKCADCHGSQKYANTPRECVACHRQDDMKEGHRGRFGSRCESCHDEEKWKAPTFRHDRDTHYALLDRHRSAKCEDCHRAPLYREKTPTSCYACHRADDQDKGHHGALGQKCDSCHNEKGWKTTRFDHDRDSRFPLRDKHKAAKCEACHQDMGKGSAGLREKLPTRCVACHDKDDREKGHQGRFGDKCESCHGARGFKPASFDHGRDTHFPLVGKHAPAKCVACHPKPLYATKTETACYSCHKADDIHFGSFDLKCDSCHVADDWRKVTKKDAATPPPMEVNP